MKITELDEYRKYRVKQWYVEQAAKRAGRKVTAEQLCCADEIIADEDLEGIDFDPADFTNDGLYLPGRIKENVL